MSTIEQITEQALIQIAQAADLHALGSLRVGVLGKTGQITLQLKQLGAMDPGARKPAGEQINRARDTVAEAISTQKNILEQLQLQQRLAS